MALPSLPLGPVTLVDLIERRGGFDWRESVAVVRQICLYLRDHSPQSPILLDPRTIQITDKGEVNLLSGQTSSDPLVIQVGRLLRTMLMGKEAPPELRLLLSQATFELPIFESIEDVDRALAQLNNLDEPGPAGLALLRAVAAPPPPPNPEDYVKPPPPIRSILPSRRGTGRRTRSRTELGSLLGGYASHVGLIFAAIAVIGGLLLTRPAILFPNDASATTTAGPAPIGVAAVAPAPAEPAAIPNAAEAPVPSTGMAPVPGGIVPAPSRGTPRPSEPVAHGANGTSAPPRGPRPSSVAPDRAGAVVVTPLEGRSTENEPPRPASKPPRAAATAGVAVPPRNSRTPPAAPPSPRDSQRRAASLLEQGQHELASMAFDSLVMSNPTYEPKTSDLSPEALAAFRSSQRQLLPGIAQSTYSRAKAALDGGDFDRALSLARDAMTLIDRRVADIPAQLRDDVQDLIARATAAAADANEIVYTEADVDVIPPRQLTTQMPVTGPVGVPPNRVGWLEMIIGRDGSVEKVKLHTPLNRHHERMIVSPAKAWRYRPATRAGRPVRYRIMVKVNLPESGTE